MGLDMYAYSVPKHNENTDLSISDNVEKEDIAYWRKFNALHGWMHNLANSKGLETGRDFNCIPLRITKNDLMNLTVDLLHNRLEPTVGFFFGRQEIYPEHVEATFTFIGKAFTALNAGQEVYYDSWW